MGLTMNFAGGGYEDIVLYLTGILKHLNCKTLILDHTLDHVFYSCIPHLEGINPAENILDFGRAYYKIETLKKMSDLRTIDTGTADPGTVDGKISGTGTVNDITIDNREEAGFELVIRLYDYSTFPEPGAMSVIVSDEHRVHAEALEKFRLEMGNVLILKNFTGVIKKQYENIAYRLGCEKVFALPFSEKDYRSFVYAGYYAKAGFSHISGELEQVLLELTGMILPEKSVKEIKKAYRAGKGGKK